MLVVFDPNNHVILHVVTMHMPDLPETFRAQGQSFVDHPETIPHHEIEVIRDASGAPVVRRRQPMSIEGPSAVAVSAEAVFEGIPEGVAVTIEGEAAGVMDSGGRLEFTPEVAGLYRICFAGSGWLPREISLEAFEG